MAPKFVNIFHRFGGYSRKMLMTAKIEKLLRIVSCGSLSRIRPVFVSEKHFHNIFVSYDGFKTTRTSESTVRLNKGKNLDSMICAKISRPMQLCEVTKKMLCIALYSLFSLVGTQYLHIFVQKSLQNMIQGV